MRALISGGGTAGHVYPALSVAAELGSGGRSDVALVGTPDGLEARLAREAGLAFHGVPSRGFDRGSRLSAIPAALTLVASTLRARALVKRLDPDVVACFGGYAALPVGLGAVLARVPLVLHEQNSLPGLANRVLSRWARAVAVTYEGSAARLRHPDRVIVTGNPVRTEVLRARRDAGRRLFDLSADALVLLVFGGSRGARHINRATVAIAERLTDVEGLVVFHVAGRAEHDDVRQRLDAAGVDGDRWILRDYVDDMGSAIAAADVVVARAGATSIAEITAVGRAAVLVPYPYATDDHQTFNARSVAGAGGAVVVSDADLDEEVFSEVVIDILRDRARREKMASASAALGVPDAAKRVADLAREHARRPGSGSESRSESEDA